jgi:low affinity Fe/Cu permease
MMTQQRVVARAIESFSTRVTEWTGSTRGFIGSVLMVVVWMATGPVYRYSDTWQLIINTLTNVVTFVMVFLIQRAQNKDALAMQIKLSELLAAVKGSADEIVAVEELSEDELRRLHARYLELARRGERPSPLTLEAASSKEAR